MMDLRKRLFIIISIAVVIVLVFLLLYLFVFEKEEGADGEINLPGQDVTVTESDQTGSAVSAPVDTPAVATPVTPANAEEIYAKQIARIFVERYASYSNQNDNQQMDDVLFLVTSRMADWLKTQTIEQGDNYQGITTHVIASSVQEISTAKAVVKVDVQQEVENVDSTEIVYQSGTVNLIKTGNTWKVDGFYWE